MLDKDSMALANYRIEKSKGCLKASKILLDDNCYPDSANRSYYAIFHAINALFALKQIGFKKHSGLISNFNLQYIKTGVFDKELGKIAGSAFEIRKDNDYADFYVVSKQEVIEQYENAQKFVSCVEGYISRQMKDE